MSEQTTAPCFLFSKAVSYIGSLSVASLSPQFHGSSVANNRNLDRHSVLCVLYRAWHATLTASYVSGSTMFRHVCIVYSAVAHLIDYRSCVLHASHEPSL